MDIDLHSDSSFFRQSKNIVVIIKLEPITACYLNTIQADGLCIKNKDDTNINSEELNGDNLCDGKALHGIIQSRVFTVYNVYPKQRLKVVFTKTGQEVEFSVPLYEEFCEVTLKDSTYPSNK